MTHSVSRRVRAGAVARPASFVLLASASFVAQAQVPPATLSPVVVGATRFSEDADKLAFGVSIITAQQIRESGASTVNEAVMKLLGVPGRADAYGGGDYSLDLRGFGTTSDSNQVIIVDGVKLSEGDGGGTRLAGIPIDTVDRIEVIRGSGAVLYGEGATGGVIVITTKGGRGVARSNQANASMTMGSHSLIDLRGNATLAAGGFSVDAAAATRETDNYRQNFHSTTDATAATVQWQGERARIGVTQAYDRLDGGLPGALTAQQYATDPSATNTPDDHATLRNRRASLFGEMDLGNWQLGLDYGDRDKLLRSTSTSNGPYGYDIDADNLSLRARHKLALGAAKNALIFGIDTAKWEREIVAGFGTGTRAEQTSHAFYANDDFTFASGTQIRLGGRVDRIEKENTAVTEQLDDTMHAWELGVVQPVASSTSIFGRIGTSYRLANADEYSFTTAAGLQPQTSRDTEIGARWAGVGARAELRLYRSALKNEIGFDQALFTNVNYDPTRRQGVELEVSGSASSTVDLRAVAAHRDARFEGGTFDGKQIPLTPQNSVALQAGWKPATAHRIDAYLNWVSSQHPDSANLCTMPAYTTMDMRYAFRQDAVELSFGIKNIADRKYYTQAYTCTAGVVESIYPEDGRNVTATVRVSF